MRSGWLRGLDRVGVRLTKTSGDHVWLNPRAGAVGPDFLLPDGHVGFEGVDDETTGGESFVAMGAGDGDEDRWLGELDAAGAVENDLLNDRPLRTCGLG